MKDYEYIKNIIISQYTTNPVSWTYIINNMPSLPPDEVIIRSITYNTASALSEDIGYMIWSSLNNDFIGAFSAYYGSGTHNPQTRIILNGSFLGNVINFALYEPGPNGPQISQAGDMQGDLIICMDFIRYTR